MRTIVVLMDSLSRRYLPAYGNTWVKTPNMDRLAQKSAVLENHFVGSAPCMPARRDLLTGRLGFMECGWGPIQPFDDPFTRELRKNGVYTHMITDHYHYLRLGGENYHTSFNTWELFRGQETDPWVETLGYNKPERDCYGKDPAQYRANRERFGSEENFPSPLTLRTTADWVEKHHDDQDWMLFVDSFDPHEPFDLPDETEMPYEDDYDDKLYYWPKYSSADQAPEDAIEHAKKRYATLISLSDKYIGKIMDVLDKYDMWEDTMVILTTDHGFMLGEHGCMAKNYMPAYNEVYHIPCFVHLPGMKESKRIKALTQNIDIYPTLMELYGIERDADMPALQGGSLIPIIEGTKESNRDAVLYGMFGKQINMYDGRYTYFRSAVREDNMPLYVYTACPTTIGHFWNRDYLTDVSQIESGKFLKYTKFPVFRFAANMTGDNNGSQGFNKRDGWVEKNLIFDLENDYAQNCPVEDAKLEEELSAKMKAAMVQFDCPEEQFERVGL